MSSPHRRTVNPTGTKTYTVTSVVGSAVVTVKPPIPTALSAKATTANHVSLTWSFTGTADRFDVHRDGVVIGSSTSQSYVDSTVAASAAYVYAVTAVKSGTASAPSTADLATTRFFTDDPLVSLSTMIRAVHVTELRDAINIVRTRAGLAAASFADPSLAEVEPKIVHIAQMRTALDEARTRLGLPSIVYVNAVLNAGNIVYAAEIGELRGGVQ